MKQLLPLFLALLPCLALAQYPSNANQKITLGEQTTADGLIYRGLAADTTRKPSVDTMAYMLLDTATNIMWHYKKATSNAWLRLNLLPSDTASMLTNYYRSGRALGTPLSGDLTFATGLPISTGLTGLGAANRIPYASSTTALTTSTNFTYDGLRLNLKKSDNFSIFIGNAAGNINAGADNVCIGYLAGYKIKSNGAGNLFMGSYSGFSDSISGFYNAGLGAAALYSLSSGNYNLGVGANSLYYVTTGSSNIGIGNNSGGTLSTGSNNIYIGDGTTRSSTSVTNEIVLGKDAVGQGSNKIMLGNSSIDATNGLYCYDTGIASPSDARDKTNIENLNTGLDLILALRPVKFTWNMRDYGNVGNKDIGFIAQEVDNVQNISGEADNIKLVNTNNDDQYWMQRDNLIPILVKAIQQQQNQIELLKQRIVNLENK